MSRSAAAVAIPHDSGAFDIQREINHHIARSENTVLNYSI